LPLKISHRLNGLNRFSRIIDIFIAIEIAIAIEIGIEN